MLSSEEKSRWVMQWRYEMAPTSRRGIWRLRTGGFFIRVRATDPRTGKRHQVTAILREPGVTMRDAVRAQERLRREGHRRIEGTTPSLPLWSTFAASLFEAKVAEKKLSSAKSRERWANVLERLIPVFGRYRVDLLRPAHILDWRDQLALDS